MIQAELYHDNFQNFKRYNIPKAQLVIADIPYIIDHDADGNPYQKCEQTAKCGNAVTPPVACALVRANLPDLCERRRTA